jgi:hypothetical protein
MIITYACACVHIYRYAGMAVSDGAQAASHYSRLAEGTLAPDETARMRKELLEYCELDTLAMVELHRALDKLA